MLHSRCLSFNSTAFCSSCRLRVGWLEQRQRGRTGQARRADVQVRHRAQLQRYGAAHKQHVYQRCSGESQERAYYERVTKRLIN